VIILIRTHLDFEDSLDRMCFIDKSIYRYLDRYWLN